MSHFINIGFYLTLDVTRIGHAVGGGQIYWHVIIHGTVTRLVRGMYVANNLSINIGSEAADGECTISPDYL